MQVDHEPIVEVISTRGTKVYRERITLAVDVDERVKLLRILQRVMDLTVEERGRLGLYIDHSILARDIYHGLIR